MELIQTYMPFIQLTLAMFFGIILGLERTFAGKTAGVRTYGLVSAGSCLLIVTSNLVNEQFVGLTDFDPMRLAAGIVTGIGFLGAGLIIFKDDKLSGLTTAAGLWVACGIGIAVGFKLFALAFYATFLALFAFTILWFIENKFKQIFKRPDIKDPSLRQD